MNAALTAIFQTWSGDAQSQEMFLATSADK